MNWYRIRTAFDGIRRLAVLSAADRRAGIEAYEFFHRMQTGEKTETADETNAVAAYYGAVNNLSAAFDLEKIYFPPQLDESRDLYENQILCERALLKDLDLQNPTRSHLLDMGCGRGRIAHHIATLTGGEVSGYDIDLNQIENAVQWAAKCGMSDRLHFQVGDHHKRLEYDSGTFDGCFSFQAVWPFMKKEELDALTREMFRVLKPGARYACSEYLLTPHFDWDDEEHTRLQRTYLPTLAATHSNYATDVCEALERAGFRILASTPSKRPAWPFWQQKRDMTRRVRRLVRSLQAIRVVSPRVDGVLARMQAGGEAWIDAEKAKIADTNWRIVAEKRRPL
jgi:sterol 24-C-methyltransferase